MQYRFLAEHVHGRRRFLGQSLAVAAGLCIAGEAPAAILKSDSDRMLAFHNLHTNESLKCRYWSHGGYDEVALEDINFLLRDFRTDEVKVIDTRLLDLLTLVRRRLDTRQPYQVISGYRSPKTNAMLRAQSHGVAKHSLHMDGKAIDVCLPGIKLSTLRETGLSLAAGGVGYYPKSGFVHLDVGRPRFW
jgi:uncharacterized protein YcbK (DUF882 family)